MARISPAKAHFLRTSAAALATAGPQEALRPDLNQYELMLAKLANDRRRLKDIQSVERKVEVKRQLLPEYRPWIEGVLQGNSGQQDDVLITVLVWMIDVGDLAGALPIARYALAHGLVMPDQYKRNLATVLAEEYADQALAAIAAGKPADLDALREVTSLTTDHDMPDQVRARLFKAIGYGLRASAGNDKDGYDHGKLQASREALVRALELDERVGVKKDIERLDTLIKNSAPPPAPDTPPGAEGGG